MMKLIPELVPKTAWCKNLRSSLSKSDWDRVRKKAYRDADYKCEICSGIGPKHPVECHEIWDYDDGQGIQKFVKVEAICPACHEVKHIGLAQVRGRYEQALEHMAKVNGISRDDAKKLADDAFTEWQRRSQMKWDCDITMLNNLLYDDGRQVVKQ